MEQLQTSPGEYIHGYSQREAQRLNEQSEILAKLLHQDSNFKEGSIILEAGCGVGAQTVSLAKNNPRSTITSIDKSLDSLAKAEETIQGFGYSNVSFRQGDILNLPFPDDSFDVVFVCFVLEHIHQPLKALAELKRVLKPNGKIQVIEGDHGSCFWHPETQASLLTWNAMIQSQQALDHDPNIGRRLYSLLLQAGFKLQSVVPKYVYADKLNPPLLDGMVNKIIVPMAQTAKQKAIADKLIQSEIWEQGINDLNQVESINDGSFFYTWFQAIGTK